MTKVQSQSFMDNISDRHNTETENGIIILQDSLIRSFEFATLQARNKLHKLAIDNAHFDLLNE